MMVDVLIITFINNQSTGQAHMGMEYGYTYEPVRHYFQIEFARQPIRNKMTVGEFASCLSLRIVMYFFGHHKYIVEWSV